MTELIAERTITLSSNNPIIAEHTVYGSLVFPGLAYLDLIYQFCGKHGLALSNHALDTLRIHRPLIIADEAGSLPIRISLSRSGQTHYEVVIDDPAAAAGAGVYASAKLVRENAIVFRTADAGPSAVSPAGGARHVSIDTLYEQCRDSNLKHGDYMRAHGDITVDDVALVARLELGVRALAHADRFLLHPVLLDTAAIVSNAGGNAQKLPDGLYLPLLIESFRAAAPITRSCVVMIRHDSVSVRGEVISLTLEFFAPNGDQLAEMIGFTAKRVRDANTFRPSLPPAVSSPGHTTQQVLEVPRAALEPTPPQTLFRAASPAGQSLSPVVNSLRTMIADKLGVLGADVALDKGYYELGLDSADLLDLVAVVAKMLALDLSPTLMFEYSTLAELNEFAIRAVDQTAHHPPPAQAPAGGPNYGAAAPASQALRFRFVAAEPYLQDHLVLGKPALMGVTHPCLVFEACLQQDGADSYPLSLAQVRLEGGPVTLEPGEGVELAIDLSKSKGVRDFAVRFRRDGQVSYRTCCHGRVETGHAFELQHRDIRTMLADLKRLPAAELEQWYEGIPQFTVGPLLRTIRAVYTDGAGLLVSEVRLADGARKGGQEHYAFDPLLLNSCFFFRDPSANGAPCAMYVPLMIERIDLVKPLPSSVYLVNRARMFRPGYASFDVDILSTDGEHLGRIVNASIREASNPQSFENADFVQTAQITPATIHAHDSNAARDGVAIIGLAGRYPGADTLDEFWLNLKNGKDSITEIPPSRWDHALYFDPDKGRPGKTYSKWGGFLADIDQFDPYYFGITPREAELMDPQERLFLQCAVHALEDAGYTRDEMMKCAPGHDGKSAAVGIYVGVMHHEYQLYGLEQTLQGDPVALSGNAATIANRVSYVCNFTGPSMAIDTMCSSSLSALFLACRALKHGDCAAALVGGVNLSLHPNKYLMLAQGHFISSQGRCEAFGKGGDGYVPGEGVGALLLKPLARAEADGDHIYGIIRACEINHGGRSAGYSVPSVRAQAEVIAKAYARAGLQPRQISYLEAHGTGTALGDPIEIASLATAFQSSGLGQFCAIGSVKSNIGHCESAAGVAGITKVLLQMKHRQLVPSLHAAVLNPAINFSESPFVVQQTLSDWTAPGPHNALRVAGLSSFGAGGSNAHVVLEEYRSAPDARPLPRMPVIIPLSAGSWTQLQALAQMLVAHVGQQLDTTPSQDDRLRLLGDISYTLQVGRDAHRYRLGVWAASLEELVNRLTLFLAADPLDESAMARLGEQEIYAGEAKRGGVLPDLSAADVALLVLSWSREGKTTQLLRFWCRGGVIDWSLMRANRGLQADAYRRVSLPGYPFAKERYWVPSLRSEPHDDMPTVPLVSAATPRTAYVRLADALSEISGFPAERLDPHADFEALGLDSVMITKLNQRIAMWTGENDAALLFKYKTLADLAAYLDPRIGPDASANTPPSAAQSGAAHRPTSGHVAANRDHGNDDAIAIVGMSGRYPQAETLDTFWANLVGGVDCVTEIPRERFDCREIYRPNVKGKSDTIYCKWGGFLGDISQFDAAFFKLSAQDAALMDPQERQFLEMAWVCLESSGYLDARWQSRPRDFGVFAGVSFNNYQLIGADALNARAPFYPAGSQTFSVANRISFFFNFTGPSVVVDTACSSSMYALHLACESLRSGETEAALAGGVNLILHPSKYLTLCASSFAASDGRCHAFAVGGDGYVPGEGVGVVLLKRYADAIKAGDTVLALIKGTGISHDGKTQGFTVPNPVSQTKAIKAALARSKVSMDTISYIEAHGTGTALGDPIEIQGLMDAYPAEASFSRALGSVKANIGHSEAAAGIAQLTKTVLQLQHKMLVPTLLHGPLNPDIPFAKAGFYVPEQAMPWPVIERNGRALPRRAGISSFGAGGVNVHMILEEAPVVDQPNGPADSRHSALPLILPLSAHVPAQLPAQARRLADFLDSPSGDAHALHDVAFTLQHCKPMFRHRLALVVRDRADALHQLRDWLAAPDFAHQGGPYRGDSLDGGQQSLTPSLAADSHALAQAWTAGAPIAWPVPASQSGAHPRGRFVPLPCYPFLTKRYWISDLLVPAGAVAAKPSSTAEGSADLDGWLMQTYWSEVEWTPEHAAPAPNPVVVLCEDDGVLQCWAAGRTESVHSIILDRDGTFDQRLSHLLRSSECETFVLVQPHASLVTASTDCAMLDAAFQARAGQLTRFVERAVDLAGQRKGLKLILVNLTAHGETDPIQEALSRYFSFLRFEVPEIGSLIIDTDSLAEDGLNRIHGELHCAGADTRVRLRDGKRLCQRLCPLTISRPAGALNPFGAMILTGGFGGIGLTLLRWLVDQGVRQLIVIGRKPASSILQHPSLPSGTRIQDFIDELARTRSVTLSYIQSDLRDEGALRRHLTGLRAVIGMPITGVFHLAGITTDAIPIRETTVDILSDVVRPKLVGAHCLDRLTSDDPVRYFCLFSSISSVEGMQGNGLSAYSAANASLVALAAARRRRGRPTQVIQWTDWDGAGMAVAHNHRAFFDALGMSMLTPEQGVTLLERILTHDVGESIVFDADWRKYAQVNRGVQRLPVFSYYAARLDNARPRPEDDAGEEAQVFAPGTEIISVLLEQLSILLGQDDLHPDQTFAEIGLDSINSLTFFAGLSDRLSFEILPSAIFRYPTIRELASFIDAQRGSSALTNVRMQVGAAGTTGATPLIVSDDSSTGKTDNHNSIGIIGMSGQFPQAQDLPAFWTRLIEGFDGVAHYPSARRDLLGLNDSFTDEDLATVFGGYLDDIDLFDPGFFNISPREARLMDPQQRLLMLNAQRAIEDAGIRKHADFANTGVFIAQYASEYMQFANDYDKDNALFIATGNASAIAANRLSYYYGFKGPSLVLDTACSSTLVALDIACQYLRSGQIDFALVGGVSLNLNPGLTRLLQDASMLSPTGKCHTFDARADGYVPGEGVGMIVLQRFDKAQRHRTQSLRPRIYAVVAGSAVNQDGKSNGMTAPNGCAQEEVIRAAFRHAGLSPTQAGYIETHGTGTYLGDPVEIEALGNVVNVGRPADHPCILGCLKTNIGHLEPAAGIAGVIKAALCLYLEKIPANNHLDTLNPLFKIPDPGFRFPDKPVHWSGPGRIAGVSSFGFGGVNGHIVLSSVDDDRPEDGHVTTGPDRERRFLDTYPATGLTLKSYWARCSEVEHPAAPMRDAASAVAAAGQFLPLIHCPSATETLRLELTLRPGEAGLMDTGNFHVGFYLDVIYRMFSQYFNRPHLAIRRFEFLLPLLMSTQTDTKVQVMVEDEGRQGYRVTFYYQPIAAKTSDAQATADSVWTKTAQARVEAAPDADIQRPIEVWLTSILSAPGMPHHTLDEAAFYSRYAAMGFPADGFIRAVRECRFYDQFSLAPLQLDFGRDDYGFGAHPGFIDAALQPSILLADTDGDVPYMTTVMEDIWLSGSLAHDDEYQLVNVLLPQKGDEVSSDAPGQDGVRRFMTAWAIVDGRGQSVMTCGLARLQQLGQGNRAAAKQLDALFDSGNTLTKDDLLTIVAELLDCEQDQIDLDKALLELGMDSLMLMKLQKQLDNRSITIKNLFQASLRDLIAQLQSHGLAPDEASTSVAEPAGEYKPFIDLKPWSRQRHAWVRGQAQKKTSIRLYCFPYAHMSTAVFNGWQERLPDHIEVRPIELPGRGDRFRERPLQDVWTLASTLTELLGDELEQPFALYGHSAGALMAYVWCLHLRASGMPLPKHLFAAAFSAPVSTENPVIRDMRVSYRQHGLERLPILDDICDPNAGPLLTTVIDALEHSMREARLFNFSRDLIHAQLPALISTFEMVDTFRTGIVQPLPIPVSGLHGARDIQVQESEVLAWRQLCNPFTLRCFDGNHLFIEPDQCMTEVVSYVGEILTGDVDLLHLPETLLDGA